MEHTIQQFYLPSKVDGLQLSVMTVLPVKSPVGVMQISHGMCDHKERYLPFLTFLAEQGYACIIHDHRGHGGSVIDAQDLGYFYQAGKNGLIADLALVGTHMRKQYPTLPFYLLGHSMGSFIARAYLKKLDYTLDGLILTGCPVYVPGCKTGLAIIAALKACKGGRAHSKLLDRLTKYPDRGAFAYESSPNAWVCSDPDILEVYDHDPLTQFTFTLNGYQALLQLMDMVYSEKGWRVSRPELPILFLSGAEDPCLGSPKRLLQAATLLQRAGYRNVACQIYPGMRHEVLNEVEKWSVWQDVLDALTCWRAQN